MTREDIIRMIKQSGVSRPAHLLHPFSVYVENFERFAVLVAAHEREACAEIAGPHLDGAIAAAIRARGEK